MKGKTITERIQEVRRLYEQLDAIGLHDGMEAIAEFRKLANTFVRTGESSTGALPIPSANRILVYTFSCDRKIPCTILLRAV
jgi:hypothetical protein